MTSSLEGRLAVVTGGASGIGEACAHLLAARGARLVIADIDGARAQAVAATIPKAVAAHLDVTQEDMVDALANRLMKDHGAVDILVTSAGVLQPTLPPEELTMAVWDHVVAVDQRGVYLCCRAFGARMARRVGDVARRVADVARRGADVRRRGTGVIVNIASVAGMRSMPLHAYAPAKAAVIGITEGLAAEWGRFGVRVNAIAPGFVLTPALQAAVDAGQRDLGRLADASALGRLVGVDEIAAACAFLASDDASAITGVTLPVDAGWLVAGSWQGYGGVRPAP